MGSPYGTHIEPGYQPTTAHAHLSPAASHKSHVGPTWDGWLGYRWRCGRLLWFFGESTETTVHSAAVFLPSLSMSVKLATYSYSFSASSCELHQNVYIGRSRHAEHEYDIRFALGQTV